MSEFTRNLRNIENMKNDRERIEVSNFYVTNYLRENDCCISLEDWKTILFYDYDPWCLISEVTEHWTNAMKRKVAKIWWKEFEYIETNDYGMTMTPFMFWPEGICQLDIIEAFKDFFDVDIITDKDFMGMKSIEEGFDMDTNKKENRNIELEEKQIRKMEPETNLFFADGECADIYRHDNNDYSIWFHMAGNSVRGTYMDIVKEIERKKKEMDSTNNRDLTPEMAFDDPMVSRGEYLNFWTAEADYDVYIVFHELQTYQHEEVCEKVVHQIMNHRKINDTKEKLSKRIQDALWALVDWEECEPSVFITHMKGSDN